jgi:secreted PhoX family phosphatase
MKFRFQDAGVTGGLGPPQGIVFDSDGDLWISYCGAIFQGTGTIIGISTAQLRGIAKHRTAATKAVISEADLDFDCPDGLAFDRGGNLWVANSGSELGGPSLVEFKASDLAQSGNPNPIVKITSANFAVLADIKFDGAGNLWVADRINYPGIFEFNPNQLLVGGSQTPNLILSNPVPGITESLAIDRDGNLWVGSENFYIPGGTIQKFSMSELEGSGTINPTASTLIEFDPPSFSGLASPTGLAFDSEGNLWVADEDSFEYEWGSIVKYAHNDLQPGGNPTPILTLESNRHESNLYFPTLITFGPPIP